MSTIYIGATARIDITLTVDGVDTDPSALSLIVEDPAGAETTYVYGVGAVVTKLATGRYRGSIDCTSAGRWLYRWVSPGPTAKGAVQGAFDVEALNV